MAKMSGHVKDLRGQSFTRLLVIDFVGYDKRRKALWKCRCDCGNEVIVTSAHLKQENVKSCGCLPRALSGKDNPNFKHGMNTHPLYSAWKNMRERCSNPNNTHYKYYGERNITVCDEWNDFLRFYDWAIKHGWRKGLTIDRIDNDKGYSPDNCRLATLKEQVRNRRKTVYLEFMNERKPLSEWVEEFGLNMKTCYGRLHDYGWTNPEEILFGKGGMEKWQRIHTQTA